MSHVRRQIREAAAALVTGLATTGTRVFQSRVYPLNNPDLPCLTVYTDDEDITAETISTLLLERSLHLKIDAYAKANANLDDTLDQILAEVETVLNGSTLGNLAKTTLPVAVHFQMVDSLEKPAGKFELDYLVSYYTSGSNPQTAL
jgi:hypothetical protein